MRRRAWSLSSILALAVLGLCQLSCSDSAQPPAPLVTSSRPRRTAPPASVVRALPPHAIRSDGVGPYLLGESLATQLDELPSGPRLTLLDIPGVVHFNVIRAEQGSVLVGGDPLGPTAYVAVVAADVARTESGLAVGATRSQVETKVHMVGREPTLARDPRISLPVASPGMRLIFDGDDILRGLVVLRSAAVEPVPPATPLAGTDLNKSGAASLCLIQASATANKTTGPECPVNSETVKVSGEDIVFRTSDSTRPAVAVRFRGLVWTAVLEIEQRETLVVISRQDTVSKKTWTLSVLRIDQGKLLRLPDQALYVVTSENARWIGAELGSVDLVLEIAARGDTLHIGGLLSTATGSGIRDLVPLLPVTFRARFVARPNDPAVVPRISADASPL